MIYRVLFSLIGFLILSAIARKYYYKQGYMSPAFAWIIRIIRNFYMERLTSTGRALFWLAILAFGFSMGTTTMKSYMVFTLIMSLFLASIITARIYRPKLAISYEIPARTTAGQIVSIKTIIRNDTRRNYYDVVVKDRHLNPEIIPIEKNGCYISLLGSGEATDMHTMLEFTKRGSYLVNEPKVSTFFPFGIWLAGKRATNKHQVLVYPSFSTLEKLDIPVGNRYQPGGIALAASRGESTEFIGNRNFVEGDNPRNIHWRSWARTGKPVVKEFQEEYLCRVALFLDTFVPVGSRKAAYIAFEKAISTAASIADYLSRQEYIVDIFAAGPDIYHMQAGMSLAYLENILDLLACLDVCRTSPFEKIEPVLMENLSQTTTVIAVFLDWDARRERIMRLITEQGTAVKIIIVRKGSFTLDPFAGSEFADRITVIDPVQEVGEL